jgi:hypothetical protein
MCGSPGGVNAGWDSACGRVPASTRPETERVDHRQALSATYGVGRGNSFVPIGDSITVGLDMLTGLPQQGACWYSVLTSRGCATTVLSDVAWTYLP